MRINLLGGPGVGKSVAAARLFVALKENGHSVELVNEYVKAWAYQKRDVEKFDQIYLFGKQHQYEYRFLSKGTKNIVTDSPCILSVVYAKLFVSDKISNQLKELCLEYEADYPSYNIILDRGDNEYMQEGRWQTKEEACAIDEIIENLVMEIFPDRTTKILYNDKEALIKKVLEVATK